MKPNGQDEAFSGYGGIEDPDLHCRATAGEGWVLARDVVLPTVDGFSQNRLEAGAPNCVPISLTRVLQSFSKRGYDRIPSEPEDIYPVIRRVTVRYGYDPVKSGLLRDLFVYTPFSIGRMATEVWQEFGYGRGEGKNRYVGKLRHLLHQLDNNMPALLNLAFGDYPSHTLTVAGYRIYSHPDKRSRVYLRVYDGWSPKPRYIDWTRVRWVPSSVTIIRPPKGERRQGAREERYEKSGPHNNGISPDNSGMEE